MTNKKIACVFKDIFDEKEEKPKVETSQALFLREHCQIGHGVYTDLRLALKDSVVLPAHNLLAKLETDILPELKTFEHGWKVNLSAALTKTLERWFEQNEFPHKECLSFEN